LILSIKFFKSFSDLQPENATRLDTMGDKIMTPVVYQNRNGTESLWADHTIILNYPNGPTAVRWYQFDVTGGNFPAAPVQQEDWTNGNDGLWRWLPSIAVDQNGNTAIGYSTSSASIFPSIRYAGRGFFCLGWRACGGDCQRCSLACVGGSATKASDISKRGISAD
jgi:hypothetical protein